MTRIEAGLTTPLQTTTQSRASLQAAEVPQVGQQIQQAIFGRVPPPIADPARFPHLAEFLRQLRVVKRKFAAMAGDNDDDYTLVLAESGVAMIDERGQIYLGAGFLAQYLQEPAVVVGVLAHEIGHRPKRWLEPRYQIRRELTWPQIHMICRHEETLADLFAGKALAEIGMDCEPVIALLERAERGSTAHPEYFPAKVRAEVIRDAHGGRSYRAEQRRKLFREFDRMTAPKGHLADV